MGKQLPRLLITTGDPNGIGPEIAVKAFLSDSVRKSCLPLLVGSPKVLRGAARTLGVKISVRSVDLAKGKALPATGLTSSGKPAFMPVIPVGGSAPTGLKPGKVQRQAGRFAYQCLKKAHDLIRAGHADGMVTCPIHKEALHRAKYTRVAHTEILAYLNRVADPITLFVTERMWIAFFTRHLPLKKAVAAIRTPALVAFVKKLVKALGNLGVQDPNLAMAALNPHGGEAGLLGEEEQKHIIPAVEKLNRSGITVKGPIPADSIFHQARHGRYDCVISLYHDQGHIAAKTADFHKTLSLTLGLPYLRTSVDHGTGFDIAWQGKARPDSLIEAIRLAARLVMQGSPGWFPPISR